MVGTNLANFLNHTNSTITVVNELHQSACIQSYCPKSIWITSGITWILQSITALN